MVVQRVPQTAQICGNAVNGRSGQGADFDHAFGDLQLDLAKSSIVIQAADQVAGTARQVKVAV
jgi:hypothetical protein